MGFSTTASLLNTLVLLSQIFWQVQGYAIDQSCNNYVTDGKDKRPMITAAVAEARAMATLARNALAQGFRDPLDNSQALLFPGASSQDFQEVQGRYQTLLDAIPWTLTTHNSLVADKVTFYCGDENFVSFPSDDPSSSKWLDLTSGFVFATGEPTGQFCESGDMAETLAFDKFANPTSDPAERDIWVVLMCDSALVKGIAKDGTTESRGSLQEAHDAGELFLGREIDNIGYQTILSGTILHELFHVAAFHAMLSGADEIYGWDECTSENGQAQQPTITLAQAKINCDTVAFYATTLQVQAIDNDLFFTGGILGSRTAAMRAQAANFAQNMNIWTRP